ncbi:RNA polymerase II transcription factor B subunit 4 [Cyanidiococcus yangmingshanensis]|uniref:RNA polymerase II transcription factor B subunit 4 n=1 Tax=Cyanidiococcus yangmingshanensis TaxID=2690220 RepID=A0A7J7IJV9_9RHOD|nr:RNA polymerase II transcription factor B subunit 4 [Cyanidiococcus yangmingshanensis]
MSEYERGEEVSGIEHLTPEVLVILFDCNLAAWARVGSSAFPSAVKAFIALARLLAVAKPYVQVAWLAYREGGQTRWLQPVQELSSAGLGEHRPEAAHSSGCSSLERLRLLPRVIERLVQFARYDPEAAVTSGAKREAATETKALNSADGTEEKPACSPSPKENLLSVQQSNSSAHVVPVYPSSVTVALMQVLCRLHACGWLNDHLGVSQELSGDLASARQEQEAIERATRCRLLVLSAPGPFDVAETIPIWNAAFCAQQSQIIVDVVRIEPANMSSSSPEARAVLQQLVYATKGVYMECYCACERLFLHLVMHILPNAMERRYLTRNIVEFGCLTPALGRCGMIESADLRATCFQTGKLTQIGYVCSRCLSVYSVLIDECIVCGARWDATESPAQRPSSTSTR